MSTVDLPGLRDNGVDAGAFARRGAGVHARADWSLRGMVYVRIRRLCVHMLCVMVVRDVRRDAGVTRMPGARELM